MIRKKFFIFLIFLCLLLGGSLANGARVEFSPAEIDNITTKPIDGSYDDIIMSCIAALKSQGYTVNHIDIYGGLIVASMENETEKPYQFWQSIWYGYIYKKGIKIQVSCKVNKITDEIAQIAPSE